MTQNERRSLWFRRLSCSPHLGEQELRVILVVLSEIGDGWLARTTPTQIARHLGKDRSNVGKAVDRLCNEGAIEKLHDGGKLIGYRVRPDYIFDRS